MMMTTMSAENAILAGNGGTGEKQLSFWKALQLQLTPGLANIMIFLPSAWLLHQAGLPVMFALALAILFGEVPVAWWIMIRRTRAEQGSFSFKAAFPWARALRLRSYVLLGVPIVLVSMVLMMTGLMVVSPQIQQSFFPFIPEWMHMVQSPEELAEMPTSVLWAMFGVSLLVFALIGGGTQELYSRGFLLPRMAHFGAKAPVLNALFFAMLHLAAPWGWPIFFLTSLIWATAVWRTRSIKIGLFGHVGMLFVQLLMLGSLIIFSPAG